MDQEEGIDQDYTDPRFDTFRYMLKSTGEHILVIGTTGTGKTQLLYYLLHGLRQHSPKESIIWFDSGKSSEALVLTEFGPLTIHVPTGYQMTIEPKDPALMDRIQFKSFYHAAEVWDNIEPGRINVICIEPFFPDPKIYSIVLTEIFRELILRARGNQFHQKGLIPMAIFIDELQWVVPGERTALNRQHNEGAKWFQRNIEYLRSMGIRIVGATQGWMKLRPGARDSFSWLILKRGARFGSDRPHLAQRYGIWRALGDDACVLVRPDQYYSREKIITKFYGSGKKLGLTYYQTEK
jgi:energy-coupling factor transporter ATP-binding protein EcfA2